MEEYQNQSLEKAISYCIENFSTKEATKRIIDYIKSDRELTEQLRQYNVVRQSEQLKDLLEKLLENNMCSHAGDELIKEVLKGF